MRPYLVLLLTLVIFTTTLPAGAVTDSEEGESSLRIVVTFENRIPVALREGSAFLGGKVVWAGDYHLIAEVEDLVRARELAAADTRVRMVEEEVIGWPSYQPNDPMLAAGGSQRWAWDATKLFSAWDSGRGSTAVKIAVLDSGIRRSHEEFSGVSRILGGRDIVNGDATPQDEGGACDWHGTRITGVLSAQIDNGRGTGGAAQVSIDPIKIAKVDLFGKCPYSSGTAASGIRHAADNGAHIIVASWGFSSGSSTLNDAVTYAWNKGVVIVAAAGNSGASDVDFPWRDRATETIIVGAVDANLNIWASSNRGPRIDLVAPGVNVDSTYGTSDTAYQGATGTSMAVPFVAATLGLVKSRVPGIDQLGLEERLVRGAQDLGPAGKDNSYGHGLLRADRTLQRIDCDKNQDAAASFSAALFISRPVVDCPGELGFISGDSEDWYQFYVAAGTAFRVQMGPRTGADFDLYLYRPDDSTNYVRRSIWPGSTQEVIDYTAPVSGWYRVKVVTFSGLGSYLMSVT